MPEREGSWLIFRHKLYTRRRRDAVVKDLNTYFESLGYVIKAASPTLIYERGHTLAGLYNANPQALHTIIRVDLITDPEAHLIIEAELRVNTRGGIALSKDHDFWRAELSGISLIVEYRYVDVRLSQYAAERAKWYSIALMLAAMSAAAVFGVVMTLILSGGTS